MRKNNFFTPTFFALAAICSLAVYLSMFAVAAHATTLVPVSQGKLNDVSGYFLSGNTHCQEDNPTLGPFTGDCADWIYKIGAGHSGAVTSEILYYSSHTSSGTYQILPVYLAIIAFSDSNYTSEVSSCAKFGVGNQVLDFHTLTNDPFNRALDCDVTFNPAYFYEIEITYTSHVNYPVTFQYGGTEDPVNFPITRNQTDPTFPDFAPQFAITANGFTVINPPDYAAISTTTCSFTNITGCFQNALTWAFYPPGGSLDTVSNLWSTINKKPPFGYFTATQSDISNLGASTSAAFTLQQVSGITDVIFDPIDIALAGIWWAIFGIWFFFNRLRHIEI